MTNAEIELVADEIVSLYERFGHDDYIGEPVSQLEHMVQAAQLARDAGYDNDIVLAAFFHDIGHLCEHFMPVALMDNYGVMDHELLGADYLASKGFSEKISRLVASHVNAKRYLTYKYPGYYNKLSAASKETLEFQGGMMSEAEATEFEKDPLFPMYIMLRNWDENAKLLDVPLTPLPVYRELIVEHLTRQTALSEKSPE